MVVGRKWVLKQHFHGEPKKGDLELVTEQLPRLQERQILFRSEYLSVDPYMRPYMSRLKPPVTMIGSSVAVVEQSTHPDFPTGTTVIIHAGWVERGVCSPDEMGPGASVGSSATKMGRIMAVPELGVSKSLLLGACGMPGNTAYFGLLELCRPQSGETVVVSGAAGAVGSLVGQIAKLHGCRVIGFAGSEAKCAWLKEIGFDEAFNYKKSGVVESLEAAAPAGVDCYFDNVGGEMTAAVLSRMNSRGRVAVCGAIRDAGQKKC